MGFLLFEEVEGARAVEEFEKVELSEMGGTISRSSEVVSEED